MSRCVQIHVVDNKYYVIHVGVLEMYPKIICPWIDKLTRAQYKAIPTEILCH